MKKIPRLQRGPPYSSADSNLVYEYFPTCSKSISEMNKDTDVDQIKLLNLNECADYLTSLSFTTDM